MIVMKALAANRMGMVGFGLGMVRGGTRTSRPYSSPAYDLSPQNFRHRCTVMVSVAFCESCYILC